jgi:hypothetical protein
MSSRAQQKAEARAAREAAQRAALQAEQRRRRLMIFGGILAVAAIALIVVLLAGGSDDDGGSASERVAMFEGIPQEGAWLGNPDAPVVVEEFADLQCPFCAQFAEQNLPAIVEDFVKPGDVRMRLRLVSILGPDSAEAAAVGVAAMRQNRGWDFAEAFFANQGPEGSGYIDDDFMRERAEEAGVDADKAFSERDSTAVREQLREDEQAFDEAKLDGTPSFRVGPAGGRLRTVTIDQLPTAIQEELDKASGSGSGSGSGGDGS